MTSPQDRNIEREGFGQNYDRYIIFLHQQILVKELHLKTVLEMPSISSKSAPSLYSIGFARAGCAVTVTDYDEKVGKYWESLGLGKNLIVSPVKDYAKTSFNDNQFDISWNFVTFSGLPDVEGYIREMIRLSKRYIMLISHNSLHLGYPWHRFLHFLLNIPWNHGSPYYKYIWNIKKVMKQNDLKIHEVGTVDSPPWPDPVGFRDLRLHKKRKEKIQYDWEVPIVECIKNNRFPLWMRILRTYDILLRKGYWKLPFSHLFYVIGEKL